MKTPEVRARIAELVGFRARLMAPALFVTFLFYVIADEQLGYATRGFTYIWAWSALGVLGVLSGGFLLRRISHRWCHVAFAALLWCSTTSTLLTLAYTPTAGPLLLLVVQVACAGILLSTRWVVITVVATNACAFPLLRHVPGVPDAMAVSALATASCFAVLSHLAMMRATVHAVTTQLAEAATARALATQLAEAERLHAQLLHAQRMEAVGTLAAGLAHDMNNVLGAMSNLAELVGSSARPDQRDDIAQIIEHAGRGAELTRGLLAFSRRGQYRRRALAFDELVRGLLPLLRRMLPKSIDIRESLAIDGTCIEGDPVHLSQVMVNLALNAADAMNGAGTIEIRCSHVASASRPFVRIEVTDTGHGMDAATQLRAFEPFFTTKPLGKGSGLGLSVVWGIVQAHDGRIDVRSHPGAGSTFVLELPTTTARPVPEPAAPVPAANPVVRSTVLVVDDEPAIRDTTRRLLTRLGLDVIVAHDGAHALRMFDEHAEAIRLVVLDMGMPVMGGAECFHRLRERSDVPVLIATGYADDEEVRDVVVAGARIIEKPFAAAQLREQVSALIDVTPPLAAAS